MPTPSDKSDLINQDRSPNVSTSLENPAIVQDSSYTIHYLEAQQEIYNKNLFAPNTPVPFDKSDPSIAEDPAGSTTYENCSTKDLTPLTNVAFESVESNSEKKNCFELPQTNNTDELLAQCATTSSNKESSEGSKSKSSAHEEEEEYNTEEAEENRADKQGVEYQNENNEAVKNQESVLEIRKKASNNEDLKISEVVHMQVRADDMDVLYFKNDFASAEFKKLDFNRSSLRAESPHEVPLVRKTSKPISTKKFQHLQKVLQRVPHIFHPFYNNIAYLDNIKDE
ncbi:unnamed protein product [Psylliodes chrysocephalus]|uniref:Uncharacterized protein n=1 Tax=Psylliodes chrysocephalus TaxID=3402493 RepID=A0A9P0GMX8_9CUCU|nr:unnamed protein product [Psylliodes chrysocephala]